MRPGTRSIGFGSPRKRAGSRASRTTSSARRSRRFGQLDRVVGGARASGRKLRVGVASGPAASGPRQPSRSITRRAVVTEVTQKPPRDAPHRRASRTRRRTSRRRSRHAPSPPCEDGLVRQRMAAAPGSRRRELALDVDERRARNVALEVALAPEARVVERPAAVDEAGTRTGPCVGVSPSETGLSTRALDGPRGQPHRRLAQASK